MPVSYTLRKVSLKTIKTKERFASLLNLALYRSHSWYV